jgi:hypothetical protein
MAHHADVDIERVPEFFLGDPDAWFLSGAAPTHRCGRAAEFMGFRGPSLVVSVLVSFAGVQRGSCAAVAAVAEHVRGLTDGHELGFAVLESVCG